MSTIQIYLALFFTAVGVFVLTGLLAIYKGAQIKTYLDTEEEQVNNSWKRRKD